MLKWYAIRFASTINQCPNLAKQSEFMRKLINRFVFIGQMIRQIFIIGLFGLFEFALKNVLHAYQMKSTLNKKSVIQNLIFRDYIYKHPVLGCNPQSNQTVSILLYLIKSGFCSFQISISLQKACLTSQFIIMYHPRFKLITPSNTINIDPNQLSQSDIDEDSHPHIQPPKNNINNTTHFSLLNAVKLKKRVEMPLQERLKKEPVFVSSDQESYKGVYDDSEQEDSSSLVFVKKMTNAECLKKKLRRLATVPNKIKLQKKDETTIECSICLSDLKNVELNTIGKLQCGHLFCFSCILQSSKFATKCPYCRAPYTQILKGNKMIQVEEVVPNEDLDDPLDQPCYVCGRNDDFERLLECEYCEYAYCHTYCDNRLNSDQPPQSTWYCLSCTELLHNQLPGGVAPRYEQIFEQQQSS